MVLTAIAVSALVMAYLALVAAYFALRTLARLRRATAVLAAGGDGHESVLQTVERHIRLTSAVADQLALLRAELDTVRTENAEGLLAAQSAVQQKFERMDAEAARGLRNVALVRFDAFEDMAGRLSFSLALLDDRGDGVTVTALAGRSDTRVYAKGVHAGTGEHDLSPEESEAVRAALGGPSELRRLRRQAS